MDFTSLNSVRSLNNQEKYHSQQYIINAERKEHPICK